MLVSLFLFSVPLLMETPSIPANYHSVQANGVAYVSVSDTFDTSEAALTSALMDKYIAMKKELTPFWKAHPALHDSAKKYQHNFDIVTPVQTVPWYTFDYPSLVKKDSTLAGIFKKNQLAPGQFAPVQKAVMRALARVAAEHATGDSQTVSGRNIQLVAAYREKLSAVGIQAGAQGGGGGGNNDLNP